MNDATSYTIRETIDLLSQHLTCVISRNAEVDWSPRSCDLIIIFLGFYKFMLTNQKQFIIRKQKLSQLIKKKSQKIDQKDQFKSGGILFHN